MKTTRSFYYRVLPHFRLFLYLIAVLIFPSLYPALFFGQDTVEAQPSVAVLDELSLEELMSITVTSVSKKSQPLSDAPAAVFVITAEDIRRSGVTSIPEALRMAPGVQVGRIDSNRWAVGVRGFNGRFDNKLLVLIDGRTIYTPLFSGVYWENEDLVLEDIERIEVIRGPGATLWGANAVNGVINIITKHARDTQGGLVTAQAGTEDLAIGQARYGGKIGDNTYYRIYSKYTLRDEFVNGAGMNNNDDWHRYYSGFRIDSELTGQDTLTVQGGLENGEAHLNSVKHTFAPPYERVDETESDTTGVNLLTRWERTISETSDLALQFFYNYSNIESYYLSEERHTFDLDFQHRFQLIENHEIIWGSNYRFTTDNIDSTDKIGYFDESEGIHLFSFFLQDEITLIEDELRLILGSKFEHHDYTGLEIQPNARLIWTPNDRHTFWGSVSRAVRTPSRSDKDAFNNFTIFPPNSPLNPLQIPSIVRGVSSTDPKSEDVLAFEVGYRTAVADNLMLDAAVFYHFYDNLISGRLGSLESETHNGNPFIVVPFYSVYDVKADSYGAELSADWRITEWWALKPAYTFLSVEYDNDIEFGGTKVYADNQFHQVSLRSQMDLTKQLELDFWIRYVGNLTLEKVPAYLTLDARLGWKPKENLELSLGVQNILDDRHPEFGESIFETALRSEIEHSVYAKVTWRF